MARLMSSNWQTSNERIVHWGVAIALATLLAVIGLTAPQGWISLSCGAGAAIWFTVAWSEWRDAGRPGSPATARRHLSYARYITRHKWYVFLACLKCGVPWWRGVIHDWRKFLPKEWGPYARNFFQADGSKKQVRDSSGAYAAAARPDEFQYAWLHHQRHRHHWQAWCVLGDGGSVTALEIPETFIREMIADWVGAGRAISGRQDPRPWYIKNYQNMVMHTNSSTRLEELLEELFGPLEWPEKESFDARAPLKSHRYVQNLDGSTNVMVGDQVVAYIPPLPEAQ